MQTEPLQNISFSRIRDAWFNAFWAWAGANIRVGNGPRITALLGGRVSQAQVVDKPVVPPVSGVILDIGPGPGFWVDLYAKNNTGDLKVYGVEPNTTAHPGLRMRAHEAGLDNVYHIIPAGIQDISKIEVTEIDGSTSKIEKGSVDCIVTLLCLCGIPEPEENITELYQYLKKGGRWYIFEHVKTNRNYCMRYYQAFVNLFWPHIIGGCELCRDTKKSLLQAGSWEKVDLVQPPEETWYATVPHIFGTLTK
ncbi:hypothetical protein PMIN03_004907 [Paraphaeosphaeria minitans]